MPLSCNWFNTLHSHSSRCTYLEHFATATVLPLKASFVSNMICARSLLSIASFRYSECCISIMRNRGKGRNFWSRQKIWNACPPFFKKGEQNITEKNEEMEMMKKMSSFRKRALKSEKYVIIMIWWCEERQVYHDQFDPSFRPPTNYSHIISCTLWSSGPWSCLLILIPDSDPSLATIGLSLPGDHMCQWQNEWRAEWWTDITTHTMTDREKTSWVLFANPHHFGMREMVSDLLSSGYSSFRRWKRGERRREMPLCSHPDRPSFLDPRHCLIILNPRVHGEEERCLFS